MFLSALLASLSLALFLSLARSIDRPTDLSRARAISLSKILIDGLIMEEVAQVYECASKASY